jgi:uncharacterized protein (TIGR02001 family)
LRAPTICPKTVPPAADNPGVRRLAQLSPRGFVRIRSLIVSASLWIGATVAHAQFSSTIGVVSDYDFRGISLSARDPAPQFSADYAFGDTGLSAGVFTSTIDSGPEVDGDFETDVYVDFATMFDDTFGFNAGATYYAYPGSDDTEAYPEAYVGLIAGDFTFNQWFTHDYLGVGDTALYTEANYSHELAANFGLSVHAGYSYGEAFADAELFDYFAELGYTWNHVVFAVRFTGTDASGEQRVTDDVFNNEPRLMFSISTTLPWEDD